MRTFRYFDFKDGEKISVTLTLDDANVLLSKSEVVVGKQLKEQPKVAPIEFPNIVTQAVNFGKAVTSETIAILKGNKEVPPEEAERRMEICRKCPFYDEPSNRCKKCGCHLEEKVHWRSQACPIGEWKAFVG